MSLSSLEGLLAVNTANSKKLVDSWLAKCIKNEHKNSGDSTPTSAPVSLPIPRQPRLGLGAKPTEASSLSLPKHVQDKIRGVKRYQERKEQIAMQKRKEEKNNDDDEEEESKAKIVDKKKALPNKKRKNN